MNPANGIHGIGGRAWRSHWSIVILSFGDIHHEAHEGREGENFLAPRRRQKAQKRSSFETQE
jgi:hypothetical protein